MRNFEKYLDKIHRKLAKIVVLEDKEGEKFPIDKAAVQKYLGKPIFDEDDR